MRSCWHRFYSAGEGAPSDISSQRLAHGDPPGSTGVAGSSCRDLDDLAQLFAVYGRQDDLVLVMGAGDVNSLWDRLQSSGKRRQRRPRWPQ